MLAVVNTTPAPAPVEFREAAEPNPARTRRWSRCGRFRSTAANCGLFQVRAEGWRPGQDISGVVLQAAADGSGPTPANASSH